MDRQWRVSYHTTEVVGILPHSAARWGFCRRPKSRRGRPSPTFRHPPTMAVTGPLWPRTADGLLASGEGNSQSIDRGSLVDGCDPYVGSLASAPAFNYGCSLGLSVAPQYGATAWGLCPSSRSSSPVQGPAHMWPATSEIFTHSWTMLKQELQGFNPYETAESGSADTPHSGRLRAPPRPSVRTAVRTQGRGIRAWRQTL
jgi:hypothetical protein